MITEQQRRAAQAIVSIFETGRAQGDPSAVAVLPDGAGISYGIHQATDGADSLDAILIRALELGVGRADELRALLLRLQGDETTRYRSLTGAPQWLTDGAALLRALGSDPAMQRAQAETFDALYWEPAARQCVEMGLVLPLSWAVIYDTCIHSGPAGVGRIRARFAELPPSRGGDEQAWAIAYVRARRSWLLSRGGIVASTTYRMDAFSALMVAENWQLVTPFSVRGVTVR